MGEKISLVVCVTMRKGARAPRDVLAQIGRTRLVYVPLIGAEVMRRVIFYFVRHVARHRDPFTQKISGSTVTALVRRRNG